VRIRLIPHIAGLDIVVRTLPSAYGATLVRLAEETDEIAGKVLQKSSTAEKTGA
jgi:hypothetical protein